MKKIFFKKIKENKGYTIIETMISISLFIIITIAGMGALLSANFVHRKSQDMRSIMDNLNFIMEDISRNIRTGYDYRCIEDGGDLDSSLVDIPKSSSSCFGIAFESITTVANISDPDNQWVYYVALDTNVSPPVGRIYKATAGPYTPSNFIPLTPLEVVIDPNASSFSVLGAEPPDANMQQPFVIIRLVGQINYKNTSTPFSLQTSMSQRLIDI